MFEFIIAGLATWRITHMVLREDGPFDIFLNLRTRLGVDSTDGSYRYKITVCHWCLSIWVAMVCLIIPWQLAAIFALSAISIGIEEWQQQKLEH